MRSPLEAPVQDCATLDLSRYVHMDKSKPPTPPSEFRFRSASQWASADIDLPSAALAKAAEPAAVERQSRSGQVEPCQDSDEPSAAVYYRNEEEVSRGFLIALSAMGVAVVEQLPQPAKPPTGKAKP
jgi:hypothetical protein